MYPEEGQGKKRPNRLQRAGEDYLKTILLLQMANGGVRSSDVAKELKVSKASVCNALKRLQARGFLTMDPDKLIRLTGLGREMAQQVMERYFVLKRCLIFMGVDPQIAHEDACRMEHDASPETVERMRHFVLQTDDPA